MVAAISRRRDSREALEKPLLRRGGRPRRRVVALDRRRQRGPRAEEAPRLGGREAGQLRRLEEGGAAVGGLDHLDDVARQLRREAEAAMDGAEQALLHRLVGGAE